MEENLKEEIIDIRGMHCKSCAEKIETKLSQTEGIDEARVSLVEEKAFVKFDPAKIDIGTIKKEIESIGYGAGAKKGSVKQGIVYGLIPHAGCIAFIIASIFGVTAATEFFKPLLLNPYFFYILIALSFSFATISSALYLRKNGLLSAIGIKRKWKYLSTMYGSTIGVNLLLFMIIFPLLANVSVAQTPTGNFLGAANNSGIDTLSSLKLQVDIPCSGHASLISGELKKIAGVNGIQFSLPNVFEVKYDTSQASKQQILALDVFKTYKATVLSESSSQLDGQNSQPAINSQPSSGGSSCGGGSGSCGCGCGSR